MLDITEEGRGSGMSQGSQFGDGLVEQDPVFPAWLWESEERES